MYFHSWLMSSKILIQIILIFVIVKKCHEKTKSKSGIQISFHVITQSLTSLTHKHV